MVSISSKGDLGQALGKLASRLTNASTVQVGFMADSTYPDGTSVPLVAVTQEFGAPSRNIPPRPFMRTMIAKHSTEWGDLLMAALENTNFDAKKALGQAGKVIEAELQQSIEDVAAPPLSPLTLMLRGMKHQSKYRDLSFGDLVKIAAARVEAGKTNYGASTKPLVDTGVMLKSVESKVE
jgi:hypothetical protein